MTMNYLALGNLLVSGTICTQEDEIKYNLGFYSETKLRLSYRIKVMRDSEYSLYEESLPPLKLCEVVKDFMVDIEDMSMEEKCSLFEDQFDWYLENIEEVESLPELCDEFIKFNEGWDSYGHQRIV